MSEQATEGYRAPATSPAHVLTRTGSWNERTLHNFIFAYGSLINVASRRATGGCERGITALVLPSFGYSRCWNFRSSTGFTALGLQKSDKTVGFNGVIFAAREDIKSFDEREVGYMRVNVSQHIRLECSQPHPAHCTCNDTELGKSCSSLRLLTRLSELLASDPNNPDTSHFDQRQLDGQFAIWTYVPKLEFTAPADKDFPICQTYIDTVLVGCLDVGGEHMASEFITSTHLWSPYFLNDSPMSRRPWLHRIHYRSIDQLLSACPQHTRFADRRHPEDYASQFMTSGWRGLWNVPKRNRLFVGRERELEELRRKLFDEQSMGVVALETVGLGGVGKTQMAIEYCYRNYQQNYGLIAWINAESSETIATDFQNLAIAAGVDDRGRPAKQVVEEVKAKLDRIACPWLLVFDNEEIATLIAGYLPKGGDSTFARHVLITSRRISSDRSQRVLLDCWSTRDSIEYLATAAGDVSGVNTSAGREAAELLAAQLGHLPLALAIAAAYMRRCDVTCASYLQRLQKSMPKLLTVGVDGTQLSVFGSLGISLECVQKENAIAVEVLNGLSLCCSDGISKHLIQLLLKPVYTSTAPLAQSPTSPSPPSSSTSPPSSATASAVSDSLEKSSNNNWWRINLSGVRNTKTSLAVKGSWLLASVLVWAMMLVAVRKRLRLFQKTRNLSVSDLVMTAATSVFVSTTGPHSLSQLCSFVSHLRAVLFPAAPVFDPKPTQLVQFAPDTPKLETAHEYSKSFRENRKLRKHGSLNKIEEVDVVAQADEVWDLLKTLSLLVVRHEPFIGAGSMHRLLQQVIRNRLSGGAAVVAVHRTVTALEQLWHFDPLNQKTWDTSTHVLEHIRSVGRFAIELGLEHLEHFGAEYERSCAVCATVAVLGDLLVRGGTYISIVLSSFEDSQSVIENAISLMVPHRAEPRIMRVLSSAYVELGKVLRYRGHLKAANKHLLEALELRKNMYGEHLLVATTLHELGVLHIKLHNHKEAEQYLTRSLDLKRLLHSSSIADHPGESEALAREEAATLHQLAVVATDSRPPRLDEAEALLQAALQVENHYGAQPVSRAATLQQLGRVAIRRGQLLQAKTYLSEALALHQLVYQNTIHINIACVHQALGIVHREQNDLQASANHLTEALRIRKLIYSGTTHQEVAYSLHELGKTYALAQNFEGALNCFEEEKRCLQQLLQDVVHLHNNDIVPSNSGLRSERSFEPESTVCCEDAQGRIEQELANALFAMRGVAKARKDFEAARQYKAEAHSVVRRSGLRALSLDHERRSCAIVSHTVAVNLSKPTKAMLETRHRIRKELVASKEQSRGVTKGVIEGEVKRLKEELAHHHCSGEKHLEVDESCRWFVTQLEATLSNCSLDDKQLFIICDGVRARVRELGVRVDDSTKDE